MTQHITEQSPSRELFAALAVDCGWASNELEGRFDDLLAALENLLWLEPLQDETENEQFERIAERFKNETGMLAPGKSQAAALCGTPTHEEREAAYQEWLAGFVARARVAIVKSKGEEK